MTSTGANPVQLHRLERGQCHTTDADRLTQLHLRLCVMLAVQCCIYGIPSKLRVKKPGVGSGAGDAW